jgi:hypothetical protein
MQSVVRWVMATRSHQVVAAAGSVVVVGGIVAGLVVGLSGGGTKPVAQPSAPQTTPSATTPVTTPKPPSVNPLTGGPGSSNKVIAVKVDDTAGRGRRWV